MNPNVIRVEIFMDDKTIVIINQNGNSKSFPRCGITKIESFVQEMLKSGNLDDLV